MSWVRMVPRSVDERHRTSTPLELLFDLTLVVAVARAAAELAHGIEQVHVTSALPAFVLVFFAIWWAWMNFSWFASAYDCDDVPYRLLTLVQMAGVLVLAAGIPAAFQRDDFTAITVGYVLMRLAMVAQWLRAAASDLEHAATAHAYAIGVTVVQVAWVLRLLLVPMALQVPSFLLLVTAELAVPLWAERRSPTMTTWHPHHIAERYGLFTIIVLGECVLAASVALQATIVEGGWSADLLVTGAGSLALLFSLWWFYFLKDGGQLLERRRDLAFRWGYGHYVVFAAVAALGAGLEVAAADVGGDVTASETLVAASIGVPVALFMGVVVALHSAGDGPGRAVGLVVLACLGCLAVVVLVSLGLPLPWAVVLMAVPPSLLVAWRLRRPAPVPHAVG